MADTEKKTEQEPEDISEETPQKELSLEDSFNRLDELLKKMEDPDIPLEDAFVLYQQGVELLKKCNEKIDTVEKNIQVLNGDGEIGEL